MHAILPPWFLPQINVSSNGLMYQYISKLKPQHLFYQYLSLICPANIYIYMMHFYGIWKWIFYHYQYLILLRAQKVFLLRGKLSRIIRKAWNVKQHYECRIPGCESYVVLKEPMMSFCAYTYSWYPKIRRIKGRNQMQMVCHILLSCVIWVPCWLAVVFPFQCICLLVPFVATSRSVSFPL